MFDSVILEVAIGLAFLYFFLSMLCSVIIEGVAAKFKWRAKNLYAAIKLLLKDEDILKRLYDSPLFLGITPKEYKDSKRGENQSTPSYISSRSFILALLESLKQHPEVAKQNKQFPLDTPEHIIELVKTVPDEVTVKKALLPLLESAGDSLEKAFANMEKWYDEAMDRGSGWYKRDAQFVTLYVAFIVAMAMNADTFAIGKALYSDPTMRAALVNMAQEAVKTPQPVESQQRADQVKRYQEEIQKLKLPLGWPGGISSPPKSKENVTTDDTKSGRQEPALEPLSMLAGIKDPFKILGILITTIMVSLGSTFWFDLLNKLVNLRGAGKKPATKEDDESKKK